MQATAEETILIQKTRELCETLIAQPEFQLIRRRVETFLADDGAKSQYQTVMEQGDSLQHKQQMGGSLDGTEIAALLISKRSSVLKVCEYSKWMLRANWRICSPSSSRSSTC